MDPRVKPEGDGWSVGERRGFLFLDMDVLCHELEQKKPIWDAMQMIWMDTDVNHELEKIISVCAESEFKISELENIYWNEVRPVAAKNMLIPVAPEWTGYDLDWLTDKITKHIQRGRVRKKSRLRVYSYGYWKKIEKGVLRQRGLTT